MNFSILELLIIITLIQLTIISLVVFRKNRKSSSNKMLILFLISQIMSLLGSLVFINWEYSVQNIPSLFYISPPFWFLYGPSIFLFISLESGYKLKLNSIQVLHFFPTMLVAIYFIVFFHLNTIEEKRQILLAGKVFNYQTHVLFSYFMIVHVFFYVLFAIIRLERYAKSTVAKLNRTLRNRLSWNRFIIYAYSITCLIYDVNFIAAPFADNYVLRDNIAILLFCLYFTLLLYRALVSSHFAGEVEQDRLLVVPDKIARKLIGVLDNYMNNEKPYLEFSLTLARLSEMIGERERHVSQVLNQVKKQNFHDYVNSYRIEEVKRLIEFDKDNKQTVLEMLYASGFNSKSAFNLAFKKQTGLSPTQYRKSVKSQISSKKAS